jgi:pyruvate dehydrogenase (quinone)
VLDQALATPGPVIVQAVVDPYEPPLPPDITLDQVVKFTETLGRGEPMRMKVATTATEEALRELI